MTSTYTLALGRPPPAPSPSSFVRFAELERLSDKHDSVVCDAFNQQHEYHKIKYREIQDTLKRIEGRLDAVERRIDAVEGRLDVVERRLDAADNRFDQFERKTDDRHFELKQELAKINNRFATRPHHPLIKVGVLEKHQIITIHRVPDIFPRNVRAFWQLQQPKNHQKLVSLLGFYDSRAYENLAHEDSDTDLDIDEWASTVNPQKHTYSLHDATRAVSKYPERAINVLAGHIGVDYILVRSTMHRIRQSGKVSTTPAQKRLASDVSGCEQSRSAKHQQPISTTRSTQSSLTSPHSDDDVDLLFMGTSRPSHSDSADPEASL